MLTRQHPRQKGEKMGDNTCSSIVQTVREFWAIGMVGEVWVGGGGQKEWEWLGGWSVLGVLLDGCFRAGGSSPATLWLT